MDSYIPFRAKPPTTLREESAILARWLEQNDTHLPAWHILRVRPQRSAAATRILAESYLDYLPVYQHTSQRQARVGHKRCLITVPKPLFPGYLFALFPYDDLAKVLQTPGLADKSLLMEAGHPAILSEDQIGDMRGWEAKGAIPVLKIPIGQIVSFPWGNNDAWLSGVLLRVEGGWTAVVEISLLSRAMQVKVDLADLVGPETYLIGKPPPRSTV